MAAPEPGDRFSVCLFHFISFDKLLPAEKKNQNPVSVLCLTWHYGGRVWSLRYTRRCVVGTRLSCHCIVLPVLLASYGCHHVRFPYLRRACLLRGGECAKVRIKTVLDKTGLHKLRLDTAVASEEPPSALGTAVAARSKKKTRDRLNSLKCHIDATSLKHPRRQMWRCQAARSSPGSASPEATTAPQVPDPLAVLSPRLFLRLGTVHLPAPYPAERDCSQGQPEPTPAYRLKMDGLGSLRFFLGACRQRMVQYRYAGVLCGVALSSNSPCTILYGALVLMRAGGGKGKDIGALVSRWTDRLWSRRHASYSPK